MADDPGIRAHRLAEEIVRRMKSGKSLGSPSPYNIAREVLIEEFSAEPECTCIPYHLIGCPEYVSSWWRREVAAEDNRRERVASLRSTPVDNSPTPGVG